MRNNFLTNDQIETRLGRLVQTERKLTNEILKLLCLADERRLYLERGYSSLFDWLTKHFGYSEPAAQRRIQAARLLRAVPEASLKIEEGSLSLTTLAKAQSAIRAQERSTGARLPDEIKAEVVEQLQMKSATQSEQILVKLLPASGLSLTRETKTVISEDLSRLALNLPNDVLADFDRAKELLSHVVPSGSSAEVLGYILKDFLKRKDPLKKTASVLLKEHEQGKKKSGLQGQNSGSQGLKKQSLRLPNQQERNSLNESMKKNNLRNQGMENRNLRQSDQMSLSKSSRTQRKEGHSVPKAVQRMKGTFGPKAGETSVQASDSHPRSNPEKNTAAAKRCVNQQLFFEDEMSGKSLQSSQSSQTSRRPTALRSSAARPAIPAALRRAVLQRDQGRCTFEDPRTKTICGSRYQVQIDHIYPKALGGEDWSENLRCLCSAHNAHAARITLGPSHANSWR